MSKYKKVKVWWPKRKFWKSNGVLMVRDMEDLIRRLSGWNYTVSDENAPKGFSWVVKDMSRDGSTSCNC